MLKLSTAVVVLALLGQLTYALAETEFEGNWRRCENKQDEAILWDVAIASCTSVIQSGKETSRAGLAQAYIARARAYRAKREYDRAIKDYSKAIELNPKQAHAYINRGIALKAKGEHKRAVADFDKAIEMGPGSAFVHAHRAIAYNEIKEYDRAIYDLNKVIELNPNDAAAYNERAWAYFKLGKPLQGLPDVQISLALNANFARAIDTRGHIFEALGRRDEAIADFRRALSIGQTDLVIQKSSGAGLVRLGATKDALPQKSLTDIAPTEVPGGAGVLRPPDITHSPENDEFGRSVVRALKGTMPQSSRLGRLKIRLLLDEKGRLRDLRLVESGGDSEMEQKVLKAAQSTSFPTPPAGSSIPDRTFLVTYVYR
jgi:TonB family protein